MFVDKFAVPKRQPRERVRSKINLAITRFMSMSQVLHIFSIQSACNENLNNVQFVYQ